MATISVKELSEELGITKQAVHKRIKQLPDHFQPKKVDGVYEFTSEEADAVRKNKKVLISVNHIKADADKEVDALKVQINELKEEKRRLYGQLDQFQLLLDQQQQLTLQSNQQIQQLHLSTTKKLKENINQKSSCVSKYATKEKREIELPRTKQGFFSRLFDKKKG